MGRTKTYTDSPVVLVFKTSNKSNAATKIKVFKNRNIDEVLDPDTKLPGVPSTAVFVHLGVGSNFVDKFKLEYDIKN